MMPKTSVKPAASKNSRTPYCRPLSSCAKTIVPFMSLERALRVVGIGLFGQRGCDELSGDVAAALDGFERIVVLHRQVVVVEREGAAHRLELTAGRLDRCGECLGI